MVQKRIAFFSYVMVHIGTTNTMKSRCFPLNVLKASNGSGGYYFINIFCWRNNTLLKLERIANNRGINRTS